MAKDNFIILDGIPITKSLVESYQIEENFPNPNDKILIINLKKEIKIFPYSETYSEFVSIREICYIYTDIIRLTSIHNSKCAKLIDKFLEFMSEEKT